MLSNYANDNKLFSKGKILTKVKDTSAKDFRTIIWTNWFHERFMASNSKKCHVCVLAETGKKEFTFNDVWYKNSKVEVILGITIDNKLNFDSHIKKMCKKSGEKLNALSIISTFLNKD